MSTTVTLIVLLLIFLTIAFETAKEHIEESADRNMKPIIGSLFGEMTVLGFLSIFTFCVTQLGYFTQLSIQLFGEDKEETLLELFEAVHYMLFFIMVFFVVGVLKLVSGAKQMEHNWLTMDAACRDVEYMTKLDDAMEEDQPSNKLGWISYLCETLFPCSKGSVQTFRSDLRLFRGIRHEFVLERDLVPPFAPHATDGVGEDSDFGRYLSICLGHTLGHAVHLSHATWLFLAFLTVNFFGVGIAISHQVAVGFASVSWNIPKHAVARMLLTAFRFNLRRLLGFGPEQDGSSSWLVIISTITFGVFFRPWQRRVPRRETRPRLVPCFPLRSPLGHKLTWMNTKTIVPGWLVASVVIGRFLDKIPCIGWNERAPDSI